LVAIILLAAAGKPAAVSATASECRVTAETIGNDAEALVRAPFDADGDAWLRAAGAGAVIGASMLWLDDAVDRQVRDNPDGPWKIAHKMSWLAGWYGKSGRNAALFAAGVVGITAAGGAMADSDRTIDTAVIMGESVVFTTVLTYASKLILGRHRPYTNDGPHRFDWFVGPGNDAAASFPSGHTGTAFALAGAASARYPDWYVQVPGYLFATSAGLQRMDVRKHWASDVIAGAILGYAVSTFIAERYNCNDNSNGADGGVTPTLSFSFNF
jgi:membrane-associated phospholipid phosphatase